MSCAYSPEGTMIGAGGLNNALPFHCLANLVLQHALTAPYTCGTPPRTLSGQISPLRVHTQKAPRQVQWCFRLTAEQSLQEEVMTR